MKNALKRRFSGVGILMVAALLLTACVGSETSSSGENITLERKFVGDWVGRVGDTSSLTIQEDGSYTGTDGCNQLSGKFKVKDGGEWLLFPEAGISTLKACEDVDAWLSLGFQARVIQSTFEVRDSDGRIVGSLYREGQQR